jgi:acyl carrier protein
MIEKIKDIIKGVLVLEEISNDISMENCVNWDSLSHLHIIIEIEMEFGISFEPEEIAEIRSLEKISDILEKKITSK